MRGTLKKPKFKNRRKMEGKKQKSARNENVFVGFLRSF